MKLQKSVSLLLFIFVLILLNACKVDTEIVEEKNDIPLFSYPDYFPEPHYAFLNNSLTPDGFKLGKKLFYDNILSSDNSINCGSCHAPVHAFADHNSKFSKGVNGQFGTRNSPSLANLAWHPNFMWDGGINHIEVMPVAPITNPIEHNETMENVVQKLAHSSEYPQLFEKAFGSSEITSQRILLAFAQFMGALVSSNSKYDEVRQGKNSFTSEEFAGYQLFKTHCNACHKEPLFTDFSFKNNGLALTYSDEGRYLITQNPFDLAKFKVPSLRNVELTNPYMHDGRINQLKDVISFYSGNIKAHANLDSSLPINGFNFSDTEQNQIIAFLKTLTDYQYISNPKFAE